MFKRVKEYDLTVSVDTVENSLQETVRKMTNTMEPMYYVILTDIKSGVIESSANNNILSIRDVVDVYDQRYEEVGVIDGCSYSSKRQRLKRYLQNEIPEIDIVDSQHGKKSQCLATNDLKGLLVHLATLQAK